MAIQGFEALSEFMGFRTDFHDANLLDLHLDLRGVGRLVIHTWRMTDQTDAQGYFVLDRHCVVTLACNGVSKVELGGLGQGTIINSLRLDPQPNGDVLIGIEAVIGVEGAIVASDVEVSFVEGRPAN